MKKLYGLMGFIGFFIMLGGAGGADRVSFGTVFWVMTSGLFLIVLSMLLIKSHNMRMRKRRYLYMRRKNEHICSDELHFAIYKRKTPEGISQIIKGKINSPELC